MRARDAAPLARSDTLDLLADASYALEPIERPESARAVGLPKAPCALDRSATEAFERRASELAVKRGEGVRRVDLGRGIVAVAEAREGQEEAREGT